MVRVSAAACIINSGDCDLNEHGFTRTTQRHHKLEDDSIEEMLILDCSFHSLLINFLEHDQESIISTVLLMLEDAAVSLFLSLAERISGNHFYQQQINSAVCETESTSIHRKQKEDVNTLCLSSV